MIHMLVIVLAGLLPTYLVRFPIFGVPTNLFEVLVWLVAAGTVIQRILQKPVGETPGVKETSVLFFSMLFLVSAIISTVISPHLRSSLGILKGWVITPLMFGLLVRMVTYDDTYAYKKIIHSLLYSGLVVALLGISQVDEFMRIAGMYDVPNSLALFLVPLFCIAFWIGIHEKNRLYQLFSVVMLVAIIATQSFGAIVALAGTMLVGAVFTTRLTPSSSPFVRGRERRIPLLTKEGLGEVSWQIFGVITLVFIATIIFFTFSGRFSYLASPLIRPDTTNSVTVRLQLWNIGIRLIKQHPIFGIGLGQFEPAYQKELHQMFAQQATEANAAKSYKLQSEFVFRDPHNWIISFWLNLGLLGLISFSALNFLAIKRAFSPPARGGAGGGGSKKAYQQAIALALISMLIFGLFDTIYWKNDLSALWWLLLFSQYGLIHNNQPSFFVKD